MDQGVNIAVDSGSWAERSAYWLKKSPPKARQFKKRAGVRQPLILSGHGVRLRVNRGSLWVQNGFTHYPQEQETWRFFPGEWRLPSRIVVLDVDGSLSFDALAWLSEHDVPLIQVNWRGNVVNVVAGTPETTVPENVRSQLTAQTEDGGLQISLRLIKKKIENSIDTLRQAFPRSAAVDFAIDKLGTEFALLTSHPPSTVSQLMGVEGRVGYAYFNAWRTCSLKWKGNNRHPIPDDWHQIGRRSSKLGTQSHPNRNATHPINAMLNYAYGILESHVRMEIIAAGLNPNVGFLHGDARGKLGLVYDLMEPLRPIVDRMVLKFVQAHTFQPADFSMRPDGVCRLNPEMARHVVKISIRGLESAQIQVL